MGGKQVNELFRMNEHGDIWQEPTLFDQGVDLPPLESHSCEICGLPGLTAWDDGDLCPACWADIDIEGCDQPTLI
jgi:hypothetical protein